MTVDFWWGDHAGVLAVGVVIVLAVVIGAFVLIRSGEMAQPRTWTGHDPDELLARLDDHQNR